MLRAAALVSGLLALSVAATLYLGVVPVDPARVMTLVNTLPLPWAAAPAAAPPRAVAPVPVSIAKARIDDVPVYLSGIGAVQAYNTVGVRSRVDGEITQVLFQEGQDVKTGDPLVIVDPRPFAAQLRQVEAMRAKDQASLRGALLDLKRYEDLVQKNFASQQQVDQQRALVDQYRAQIDNDEAQIEYARNQLGYTTVRSPLDGRVGIRQVDQGNFVRATDANPIVIITQLKPISVVFTLAANAVAQTGLTLGKASAPVTALAANNEKPLDRGTIDLVDNQVDPSTGTIKLKASFPNADLKLWPGNFVNGRITVDTRKGGVTVPAAALRHGPRGDFVWLIKSNQTAEFRAVTAGPGLDGKILIEKGVAAGDDVVVDGHFRLEGGSKVEIIRREGDPKPAGSG
jgi:multidrug efflux system membrane fusion protein